MLKVPARPAFFATPGDWRRWLAKHHADTDELWVGFHRKDSGKPSITWPESVDEALCYGWIDGVRKTLNATSYVIRFTPRRPTSIWSSVNTRRLKELIAEGRMTPAGQRAFDRKKAGKSGTYAYEQRDNARLAPAMEKTFRANRTAWAFWRAQPPGYRKLISWYVISAKQEATRAKRLARVIEVSAAQKRLQ